jgi:hypothetical protein
VDRAIVVLFYHKFMPFRSHNLFDRVDFVIG